MIDEIQVCNLALIRTATFSPSAHLTVLTGETGAGKTALINACKLLVGQRADTSVIRDGAEQAEVCGRFFISKPSGSSENSASEDEYVVLRKVGADGRSRATINGHMTSISELTHSVGPLVELCGQHECQSLLRPAEHGRILDNWADTEQTQAKAYREAFEAVKEATGHLHELEEQMHATQSQLEEARFTLKQIESVSPQEGEYEQLCDYLKKAEHAEMLFRNTSGVRDALSGDNGALDSLNSALSLLADAAQTDETLEPHRESLQESCFIVEDVARDMAGYCEDIEFDGDSLAQAQHRMGELRNLMRTYGPTIEEVFSRWEQASRLVSLSDDSDELLREAKSARDEAEDALLQAAGLYEAAQVSAAPQFAQAVNGIMESLDMGSSRLLCTVESLPREKWTHLAPTSVTFLFRPGASMQARPLARIASGGEISRVMLAIKVVLGEKDSTETLVFDEIDAGVGGSTANALASVLEKLSANHQVIAITHLAQIAACADRHYIVTKTSDDNPETNLSEVTGKQREEEIARLLSGNITKASLAHARELLEKHGS